MQRSQIVDFGRRILRDADPNNYKYPATAINPVLTEAAGQIQNRYCAIDPVPQSVRSLADAVNGQAVYSVPNDIRTPGIITVESRATSTGEFTRHTFIRWEEIDKFVRNQSSTSVIRPDGKYYSPRGSTPGSDFLIWPPPASNVTTGLRIRYVNLISLSDDSDIPNIPLSLHICIALRMAALFGATYDDAGDLLEKRIDKIFKEFIDSFKPNSDEVLTIGVAAGVDRTQWPSGPSGQLSASEMTR